MLFVGLCWLALGIYGLCGGYFNWNPIGTRTANQVWDSILGKKWANRVTMLFGAIVAGAGIWIICVELQAR